jgi:small ligand-binding sensory domain FIST
MPVNNGFSCVKYFSLNSTDLEIENWAKSALDFLPGRPTIALIFASSECVHRMEDVMEIIRIYAQVPQLIGCSSNGVIAETREIENEPGISVSIFHLPNTQASAIYIPENTLTSGSTGQALGTYLSKHKSANSWLLFGASESIGGDQWLKGWDLATGNAVTVGGFAGVDPENLQSSLFINGKVKHTGAVALALEGEVRIEPLISQGCRPVGSPWTVTQSQQNIIQRIGNRPILEVLRDTLEGMSRDDQKQARGNIFIGVVRDEYKASFNTGDFLVRNLAAIDPKSGAVAIATPLRVGQNLQFQIRDAITASSGFEELLRAKADSLRNQHILGACLCDCIGRGSSLYGVPDHDVSMIQSVFPGLPIGGLFCNGEFATQENQTLLHGYAASLGFFVQGYTPKSKAD